MARVEGGFTGRNTAFMGGDKPGRLSAVTGFPGRCWS